MEKTTNTLTNILKRTKPEKIEKYFGENAGEVLTQANPFGNYIRACAAGKKLRLQEIFLRADISEGYGYKLVSGEKHTRQRDTILKLCLGAGLSLEETQRALKCAFPPGCRPDLCYQCRKTRSGGNQSSAEAEQTVPAAWKRRAGRLIIRQL